MGFGRFRVFLLLSGLCVGGCSASTFSSIDAGVDASGTDVDASSSLPPDLRAYWKFENDGVDATGDPEQTMTLTGTSFVDGVKGKALHCTGGAKAQAKNASQNFNLGTGSATFIAWVRFDRDADGGVPLRQTILSKNHNWTTSASVGPGYAMGYVSQPSEVRGTVADGTAASGLSGIPPVNLLDDGFHMLAFVVDVTAKSLVAYVDGAFVVKQAFTAGPGNPFDSSEALVLCSVATFPLQGSLDEVMIFGRALSAGEIASVKTSIRP